MERKNIPYRRKHNAKFHAIGRTLDLLTTLDEDHLKHIVKTYLAHADLPI
jgi:hypothetical protein